MKKMGSENPTAGPRIIEPNDPAGSTAGRQHTTRERLLQSLVPKFADDQTQRKDCRRRDKIGGEIG